MQSDADHQGRDPSPLSAKRQIVAVAGFAAAMVVAIAFLLLEPGHGQSAAGQHSKPTYFVPSSEQAAAMRVVTISLRNFHTETQAEGYVAANGRWSIAGESAGRDVPGVPVLAGQSSDLLQAENDLATAAAQLRTAKAAEQRQHKLYLVEGAALKDWQQSQTDLTTAAASFETARNKLRLMGKSDRDIGRIVDLAQTATGGPATSVFTVGGPSLVWLVANIREADAGHVHRGDMAEVRVAAVPDNVFHIRISYLSGTIDPVTHRLVAGGFCRNEDGALKPNMVASFDITGDAGATAPAVPESAVIYEGDQARIWVVDSRGRYLLRNISVGRSQGGYVEVLGGAATGDRVVASGALFVDPEKTGI